MTSKTRIPNKLIWALEDIIAAAKSARTAWRRCQEIAEGRRDPVMLANLGRISDGLAVIESVAREARQGQYTEGLTPLTPSPDAVAIRRGGGD